MMLYNILPGGDTLFHKIHNRYSEVTKVFDLCHNLEESKIKYHVPYLPNFKGLSPIDLCLMNETKEYRQIFSVLKYLKLYPIDHHSRTIKSAIPTMI